MRVKAARGAAALLVNLFRVGTVPKRRSPGQSVGADRGFLISGGMEMADHPTTRLAHLLENKKGR
jgi:hypothetical protein